MKFLIRHCVMYAFFGAIVLGALAGMAQAQEDDASVSRGEIESFVAEVDRLTERVQTQERELMRVRLLLQQRLAAEANGDRSAGLVKKSLNERIAVLEDQYLEAQAQLESLARMISSSHGYAPALMSEIGGTRKENRYETR